MNLRELKSLPELPLRKKELLEGDLFYIDDDDDGENDDTCLKDDNNDADDDYCDPHLGGRGLFFKLNKI